MSHYCFKSTYIVTVLIISLLFGCKKKNVAETNENSFTINTNKFNAPNAYLRVEGMDTDQQIYYLSLAFTTGGVTYDTDSRTLNGYGEAIKFYVYSPTQTEVPTGRYTYTNLIDSTNIFVCTQKVEVFTDNYSFNYTTNQNGYLYDRANSGWIEITKTGTTYNISYSANVDYSNGNSHEPVSIWGVYVGKLVY